MISIFPILLNYRLLVSLTSNQCYYLRYSLHYLHQLYSSLLPSSFKLLFLWETKILIFSPSNLLLHFPFCLYLKLSPMKFVSFFLFFSPMLTIQLMHSHHTRYSQVQQEAILHQLVQECIFHSQGAKHLSPNWQILIRLVFDSMVVESDGIYLTNEQR